MEAFHERGLGFFVFLVALPAALPLPALGINTLIAVPLLLLTLQQAFGSHTVWLPESLKKKTVRRETLENMIDAALPWVLRLEIFIQPRMGWLTQNGASRLIGFINFIMALAVCIPIPLTNTVPSMGIALMSIGILMRDGLSVLAGAFIGIAWIALLASVFIFLGLEGADLVKDFIKSFF